MSKKSQVSKTHPTHRGSEVRQAPQESTAAHAVSKVPQVRKEQKVYTKGHAITYLPFPRHVCLIRILWESPVKVISEFLIRFQILCAGQ